MNNTGVRTWEGVRWVSITWFVGLMAVALILPRFIHNQFITGPIVNATLFLAVYYCGVSAAILIGLLPSIVALSSGLLPIVLAPMVPFIMISNAILVVVFGWMKKSNFSVSVVASVLAKYIFLYATSFVVTSLIIPKTVAANAAATMMAWPQLVTAFAGALIAYGVVKFLKGDK